MANKPEILLVVRKGDEQYELDFKSIATLLPEAFKRKLRQEVYKLQWKH